MGKKKQKYIEIEKVSWGKIVLGIISYFGSIIGLGVMMLFLILGAFIPLFNVYICKCMWRMDRKEVWDEVMDFKTKYKFKIIEKEL